MPIVKPQPRRRRPSPPAGPTQEQIEDALRQFEALGLIERDREAEAKDGLLHFSLPHRRPKKQ